MRPIEHMALLQAFRSALEADIWPQRKPTPSPQVELMVFSRLSLPLGTPPKSKSVLLRLKRCSFNGLVAYVYTYEGSLVAGASAQDQSILEQMMLHIFIEKQGGAP